MSHGSKSGESNAAISAAWIGGLLAIVAAVVTVILPKLLSNDPSPLVPSPTMIYTPDPTTEPPASPDETRATRSANPPPPPTEAAVARLPSAYVGRWEGSGTKPQDNYFQLNFVIALKRGELLEKVGEIAVSGTYSCAGDLTLVDVATDHVVLTYEPTAGCLGGGEVWLGVRGRIMDYGEHLPQERNSRR